VTAQLGPRYETSYELGRRLPRAEAIAFALRESEADGAAAPSDEHEDAPVLAQREMDVARLVAEGLTNKEIGSRLFISERTVDAHVRNIFTKLGFTSRAQIAAWIATSDRPDQP
jgi:DNA-binding NarL/FixJ family response regulator